MTSFVKEIENMTFKLKKEGKICHLRFVH